MVATADARQRGLCSLPIVSQVVALVRMMKR